MKTEQILKVLKNERECILSNHDNCYENCRETCPYYVSGVEKMEVLDFLINAYSMTEVHIKVSKEEADKLIKILNRNAQEGVRLAAIGYPDTGESCPTYTVTTEPETDVCAREIFNGICPYTNIKCEKWTCGICEVEKRERRLMEGDTE